MHAMCVGGVVQTTFYLLVDSVAKSGGKFYPMVEDTWTTGLYPKENLPTRGPKATVRQKHSSLQPVSCSLLSQSLPVCAGGLLSKLGGVYHFLQWQTWWKMFNPSPMVTTSPLSSGRTFPKCKIHVQSAAGNWQHACKVPLVGTHGFTPHKVQALGELLSAWKKNIALWKGMHKMCKILSSMKGIFFSKWYHMIWLCWSTMTAIFPTLLCCRNNANPARRSWTSWRKLGTLKWTHVLCVHLPNFHLMVWPTNRMRSFWKPLLLKYVKCGFLLRWILKWLRYYHSGSFWKNVAYSIWNKVDGPKMVPIEAIKCYPS